MNERPVSSHIQWCTDKVVFSENERLNNIQFQRNDNLFFNW